MTILIGQRKVGGGGGDGTINLEDGALEEDQGDTESGCNGG
jgi:hypothetical protein